VTRRPLAALVIAVAALLLAAPPASAHPLGNFSINHLSVVKIADGRVEVLYVLDEAEVPTVSQRHLPRGEIVKRKRAEIRRGLTLTVDGRPVELKPLAPRLSFPPGQAGLRTFRFEQPLRARVSDPRRVALRDDTFPGRVGWKAIVAEPGEGTAVRSSAPSADPTDRLRRYPQDVLNSPLDRRSATFSVEPGDGTLVAPRAEGEETVTSRDGSGEGFAAVFDDAAAGDGVLVVLLLAAFGWGALHALSPGHGKAIVAAYLIGTRGTARHALWLGLTVTVTHTIGVFALGLVTLFLSQYVLPEDLYPWLTLASGLLVVLIGAAVLRSRIRWARARRAAAARGRAVPLAEDPGPSPDAAYGHFHAHPKAPRGSHGHHDHAHHHPHDHHPAHRHGYPPETVTRRSLIGMGAAAGLIPCPSALVVLLGAIAQHEVALGLLLIVAFSVGLASTLTALGLAVVYARRRLPRLALTGRGAAVLSAISALVIVALGCLLAAQAVPELV
jgi:nickel/cobalt exporter